MLLQRINLVNFRNFDKVNFDFSPCLTVIIGENARGKTNLLEAIYFFINGIGFRESREEELIEFEKKESSVSGILEDKGSKKELKIILTKQEGKVEKKYFIQKVKKRHAHYLSEQTKAILFSPEQLKIVTDSPDVRRSYFDRQISSYDLEYKKRLVNFENSLRRRNKILEFHKDENKLKEELVFWNQYLSEQALYLTQKRQEYIDYLNSNPKVDSRQFRAEYQKSEVNESRFEEVFEKEKRYRRTLIGPQKDEFKIFLSGKNIQHFGSRSEQRLGIIWLKLNEVKFYEEKFKRKPIILLDDIFSEFDSPNKKLILSLIKKYQTVVTTTEREVVEMVDVEKMVIEL